MPGPDQPVETCYLKLQRLPASTILMSLAWFLFKMIIFVIGALVVWKRPHDVSAKLFFAHCSVTVVAFMGGFHWQHLAGSPVLFFPFLFCTLLVPPLTVHFYLWFPQPHDIAKRWPRLSLAAVYGVPCVWLALLFWHLIRLNYLYSFGGSAEQIAGALTWAETLGIWYIPVATVIYLSGQAVLIHRFFTSRTQAERNQVKWILAAAALASILLGIVLLLSVMNYVEFALGKVTRPIMFVASLLFTLAYAVSITRYKLMQAGRLLNRGFLYFTVSCLAMALFCLMMALVTLGRNDTFDWMDVVLVGLTSMLLQVLLGFWGDRLQKTNELRFHREKYQLDKAMRRLGHAVDQLVEPSQLVEQMLQSATDAVSATSGAVYLREGKDAGAGYAVVASVGRGAMPDRLDAASSLVCDLEEASMLTLRSEAGTKVSSSARQLNEMGSKLAISLEANTRLIGVVLLGSKEDQLTYTQEDRNFLAALARTTSLALQSAQGHRTIEQLREELQGKVEEVAIVRW
ncbi:MAG: GAF domain-containing protein, partial [Planctomycetales bacterium]